MDVLVLVGAIDPPPRLEAKARHVHRLPLGGPRPGSVARPDRFDRPDPDLSARVLPEPAGPALAELLADLRTRIPRLVAVTGPVAHAAAAAVALHEAGIPTELFTDEPVPEGFARRLVGVEIRPVADPGPSMEVVDSVLDLIGHTPMVRLDRTARDLECALVAKLETFNPGQSSKDRPALWMIDAAEKEGVLLPGGTIVEPTSGNTGVGLAIVAARRGYKCVFVCPDKVANDKIALLRAYGAEVIVCPTSVAPDHPDSYYSVSDRLAREIPGAWKPDQYHNPQNPKAQYDTTGPEIWEQTRGRVTHFVAGIGTGGTISGIGRYLKEQNPAIQVVGADPEGSVYSGGSGRPYLVEGIGEDFWPTTYDPTVVDRVIEVSDAHSFGTARRVTREEGLLLGGSGGTAVAAALTVGRDAQPDAVIVVHIPDSGRGYLSKLYNDAWMADYGFVRAIGPTVGDLLEDRDPSLPALVHTHPDETVREAIGILREYSVSQMPVVKHEPPVVLAEVVGSVSERDLMDRVFADARNLDLPVGDVMAASLPTIGVGEPVDVAVRRLESAPAVLVLDRGHPVGVVTRSDVLGALTAGPR